MKRLKANKGFTLIEVLIGLSLFVMIAFSIFFTYGNMVEIIGRTRNKTLATAVLDKEIEILRNLTYGDVGITNGYPVGVLEAQKTLLFENINFTVETFVRNIDDPSDGTSGGIPNDTAPADYKLVELKVSCTDCAEIPAETFTTWVAPENLETSTNNGSLFINVFNAAGLPVSGADIRVENNALFPTITILDATNNSGTLELIDIPPSINGYEITVTKAGYYTSARTYTPGDIANPNPIQPHATVATQNITQISFAIDKASGINVKTQDYFCNGVGGVFYNQIGQKLIGSGPDVPAYSNSFSTDPSGLATILNLPWDLYSLINIDTSYETAGFDPLVPIIINPNTTTNLTLNVEPIASSSLLVTVVDQFDATVPNAIVRLQKFGFDQTLAGGEKDHIETDWAPLRYTAQDGNIDTNNPAGAMHLLLINGKYPTSTNSWLTSNTINFGTASTEFKTLSWNPANQPAQTTLQFQLASDNGAGIWNYVGPDNTPGTFYTTPGQVIGGMHDGKQYLRYKVFLNTTNSAQTPNLQDLTIRFDSDCTPDGNIFWSNIPTGIYDITVDKTGYTTATSSISVGSGWQEEVITLLP